NSYEDGKNKIDACITGGVKVIEITYTMNKDASNLISYYRQKQPELIIGAGTVLDEETARIAILHGAQFIVSPVFNKKIAFLCNKYSIPYIPGCMTLTECVIALKYGAEIVKLFPG